MNQNMGKVDRMVRAVLGLTALVLLDRGLVSGAGALVLVAGVTVLFLTSLARRCPLYVPIRISTAPKPENGAACAERDTGGTYDECGRGAP